MTTTTPPPVTIESIEAARERIGAGVRQTPVWPSSILEQQMRVPVVLKCEQLQHGGSFKIRGALNAVHSFSDEERARGLIAASADNHAQGVALAARDAGTTATVVMPEGAHLVKAAATEAFGANIIFFGESLEEARAHASELAERDGRIYIPPTTTTTSSRARARSASNCSNRSPTWPKCSSPLAAAACSRASPLPSRRAAPRCASWACRRP